MELWQFFVLMWLGWHLSFQLAVLDSNRKRSAHYTRVARFLSGFFFFLALIFAIYPKVAHACVVSGQEYKQQCVYGAQPVPAGYVYYIHTLTQSAVLMPSKMAGGTMQVWAECEVRSRWFTLYGYPEEAIGKAGELGQAQIHPVHFSSMRHLGLDPYQEVDRIRFAVTLWQSQGWQPWSCRSMLNETE